MQWSEYPNHTFRCLRISPLIFATVQNFALDNLRDQQILIPTCEWGCVVMVPLLNTTLEVEESPGMVCIDRVTFKLLEAPPLPMEGKVHCIHCPGPGGEQIPITLQCFDLFLPTLHVRSGVIKTRWKDKWLSGLHSAPAPRLSPRLQTPRYKGFGMRLY